MLVLVAIPALSLLFLQNRQVQTVVSKYVAERLSEELQAYITLSSVNFSFFKRIQVRDLYIEDQHGDTLIYSELTRIRIKQLGSDRKGIEIKKVTLENTRVNFVVDSSGVINLDFLIERLEKPHVPPEKKSRLHISEIELVDGRFSLTFMVRSPEKPGVNFTDLHFTGLQIMVADLVNFQDTVQMDIVSLEGSEKSGFDLRQLTSHLSTGKSHLNFSNLQIVTLESDLHIPVLSFTFENWGMFQTFSKDVELLFQSEQSALEISDLAYFIPGTEGLVDRIDINGHVHGKFSDLRGEDLFVTFDQRSSLAFDFLMIGMPDYSSTFLDFHFRELNTSINALHRMAGMVKDSASTAPFPWSNLGRLDFTGQFTGYPDDFVATGLLKTDMGRMIMDLSFKPDSILGVDFNGRLRTSNFRLGEFLAQEDKLEQLDMDVMTSGSLYQGNIQANLKGNIDTIEILQYAYSNINLDGVFTNNRFEGGFSIVDPNIKMDFLGRMDFSGEVPSYNFTADVARARPYFLHLVPQDPNSFASFLIETDFSGKTVDEMNGEIKLVNSLFVRKDAQLQLYDLSISARNTADTSLFLVRSDMFDARIEGQYELSHLPASFMNLADRFMNVKKDQQPQPDTGTRFFYEVEFKRMNPLLDFFLPELQIGDESQLHGTYDPSADLFSSNGFFPMLQVSQNNWTNVDLFSEIRDDEFRLDIQSDSMTFGENYSLVEQQFVFRAANDTARLDVVWDNRIKPSYSGEIKLLGTFQPDSVEVRGIKIDVEPTAILVQDDLWEINGSSVLVKKGYIAVDSLEIKSEDKYLAAHGIISAGDDQDFKLEVNNLNLDGLSGFTEFEMDLEGSITGKINFKKLEGNPYIFSDLTVDTLYFNNQLLGHTNLNAAWTDSSKTIHMNLLSEIGGERSVEVDGTFTPGSSLLDFNIQLKEFQLQSLNPYTSAVASDLEGTGNVNMTLDGTFRNPELNGTIELKNGAATIPYINTRYTVSDRVRVFNNNLYLENVIASDEFGNLARINGAISNTYLKDFYFNLNINANNLLALNTTSADNEDFYGTAFGTGNVTISGRPDDIKLGINAIVQRNTAIYLPLYNASEVQISDFITFVQELDNEEERNSLPQRQFSGLEMDMEVEVTPDAVVQLIFDPKVGDIIETSGRGTLRIMLDQAGNFSIFGDMELIKGDYLFTLQNVINKRFQIEPGGSISFNGSPTDATLDLNAVYTTRTAPYNLYPGGSSEAPEQLKNRIPVDCLLFLKGELLSPTISTGIKMPTADARTRDLLEASTSTEEELMRQFLALLVINNFYSISGYGVQDVGTMNSSIAGVTASELLSNQLSNWLSQISDDFDIGVNYRPGDQISSDEVEVALSTQLLNDRIIISGNVDVGGQDMNPSQSSNNPYIVGDFDVEFKVTDNVSVIAFNRARDELLFETAPYKQGVGVSYREEFDTMRQLLLRYREGISNRKKKKINPDSLEPEN